MVNGRNRQFMDVNEAFDLISGWPNLPPYDAGIGVGGAFRDTAYALLSELLPDCRDEDDLRMAIEKGRWDERWRGGAGLARYWRCHRVVHAAVRDRRARDCAHDELLVPAGG
jgi:hypothetical protein